MDKKKILKDKKIIVIAVLIVALIGGFLGYYIMHKPQVKHEEKIIYVKTVEASEATGAKEGSYPGVVKGRYETNLSFQVPGRIIAKNVQMGQRVQAGEVLMVLDDKDMRDNLDSAQAQVAAAKSQLDLATTTVKRYRQLYSEAAVSSQTLDQMEANYRAALANYNNAQAQASRGSTALGYTKLRAPGNGVISQVIGEVGQVVAAGQAVMVYVADGYYEVEISVPENRLANVKLNAPAEVELWSDPNNKIPGYIREISPMADAATRAYRVRVALNYIPETAKLGMTAKVLLTGEKNEGIILPLTAIYQVHDNPQVWVVEKDEDGVLRVHLKNVKVHGIDENSVEVTGLDNDATIVVAGVNKLVENQKVALMKGDN